MSALAGCVGPLGTVKDRFQDAIGTCPDVELVDHKVTGTDFSTVIVSGTLHNNENAEVFVQLRARVTVAGETAEDYRRVRLLPNETTSATVDFSVPLQNVTESDIEYEVWINHYSYLPCD